MNYRWNMSVKAISRLLFIMAFFVSGSTVAESTTINIGGNVIASPCVVSSDSVTKSIALDGGNGFQAKDLQTAAASSEWVMFDIKLTDCPAGTNQATMTFSGTPDTDHPEDMYANSGTAKNVAVQLQGTGGHQFGNGKSYTASGIADDGGTVEYHLRTRAYTNSGSVTPGTIQTVVTANFTYQ